MRFFLRYVNVLFESQRIEREQHLRRTVRCVSSQIFSLFGLYFVNLTHNRISQYMWWIGNQFRENTGSHRWYTACTRTVYT